MLIHEPNDEFLRPTNTPWKCPNCGKEFYTISVIVSHKETCTKPIENTNTKKYEEERRQKIQKSFMEFKKQRGIK